MNLWQRISTPRLMVQIGWLIFANAMIFGLPAFGEIPALRNVFFPDATTKFFQNAPTYSIIYMLQDTLVGDFATFYMGLVIPILIFVTLVLVMGRFWCAWLCPLGLPQDLLTRLRRSLGIKRVNLPPNWSVFLHQMKYLGLFLIIFYTFALGFPHLGLSNFQSSLLLPYELLDPNRAMYVYPQIWMGLLPASTVVPWLSILTFGFFLMTCFPIRRFWCHLCPAGALMAPLNKYAMIHLKKDASKCTHCGICARVCPMEIKKVYTEREQENVTVSVCVHCYRCVESCPEEGCLGVSIMGKVVLESKYPDEISISPEEGVPN
ncbi:MAG: 4Fe-4S binding protein [Methanomassiliicoccales archaeon]|nr:MAG: 4Fe-4S binding protein [Methanomassiliicoccales archaeon]